MELWDKITEGEVNGHVSVFTGEMAVALSSSKGNTEGSAGFGGTRKWGNEEE